MRVTYDSAKRQDTLLHRGVDMARAGEILAGVTLTLEDDRKDYGEQRFISIGYLDGRMVVLVWTPRDKAFRIISMRKANDREQALYSSRLG